MTEEIESLSATPDITKSGGLNLRRSSTGCPSSSKSGGTSVPNYLRASTGSCHDFCKYGKKHANEAKARRPWHKRITSSAPSEVESEEHLEIKKTTFVKLRPSASPNTITGELPKAKKLEVSSPSKKSEHSTKQASSNPKQTVPSSKPKIVSKTKVFKVNPMPLSSPSGSFSGGRNYSISQIIDKNSGRSGGAKNDAQFKSLEKRTTSLKQKPTATVKPLSSSHVTGGRNGRKNIDGKIAMKGGNSKMAAKKVLAPPAGSFPKPSLIRVASLSARKVRSLKIAPPPKNEKRVRKLEPKEPNNDRDPEKILHVVTVETENKTLASTEIKSPLIQSSTSSLLSSPKSSSSPRSSLLTSPLEEDQGESRSSLLSLHLEEDQEESEYTVTEEDDSILDEDEAVDTDIDEYLGSGHKMRPRNVRIIALDDNDKDPIKLKFRRGKVIDLESENNTSRKLRFRRGRLLGENARSEVQRRSFKKRDALGGDIVEETDTGSGKVALRHQDVQGKKDAQGLFNNVIEETASKLVETRKSKVKALVGAFETVISLQESKPSSTTAP